MARLLPELDFIMVGDGPYRNYIEKIKPKNLFIIGYLKGEKLAKSYSNSDIFLFPSETETYGLVVLEAMASGLPVIVSNKGAAHEHIEHNKSGFITETEEEYLKYIDLLINNENIKTKISKEAFYTAQRLNLEKTYLQYINEIFFNREKNNEDIRHYHLLPQKEWRNKEIYR
ncbi:glycosyltransferase [Thermodesulfatator autotrophicus]